MVVAMGNFEKCTVTLQGGPCSQQVTGDASGLNQPQSGIINNVLLWHFGTDLDVTDVLPEPQCFIQCNQMVMVYIAVGTDLAFICWNIPRTIEIVPVCSWKSRGHNPCQVSYFSVNKGDIRHRVWTCIWRPTGWCSIIWRQRGWCGIITIFYAGNKKYNGVSLHFFTMTSWHGLINGVG